MDLLRTAVVDITTLVATCHALASDPAEGDLAVPRKLRHRLRRELKRGAVAYIDVLARSQPGLDDDALLAACRMAAEQPMAYAIQHQDLLGRIMASEPGSLDGAAASRQDLWRLAHMATCLRIGVAALSESGGPTDAQSAAEVARRLRRRFRKALTGYARAILRTKKPKGRLVTAARQAALAAVGDHGLAEAERLAEIEADGNPKHTFLRPGVAKPLLDLFLDWQARDARSGGSTGTGLLTGQGRRGAS